ncbi:MAG: hypothetical protein HQK60_15365 [Deltaproteobacteria bacterium]|nr:hypothetical protein [Deltaproteobacteria bacterium]
MNFKDQIDRFLVKKIFLLLFLLIVVLPFLQKKFAFVSIVPLQEFRPKVKMPEGNVIAKLYSEGRQYAHKYGNYFDDNYGFRDILIRLKNQLDYSVFGLSDNLILGKDGWMEYRDVIEKELIANERMNDAHRASLENRLLRLNAFLADNGITLILVPTPRKFSIHPEHFPNIKVIRPDKTAFDRLIDFFYHHPEIHFIDAEKVLNGIKEKYPVFYKTDTHWNQIAAFCVARELVNKIATISGKKLTWDHKLVLNTVANFSGGLNNDLATFDPPTEERNDIVWTWAPKVTTITGPSPFQYRHLAPPESCFDLLPKTVIVGDSFAGYFFYAGLYEYFADIYSIHNKFFNKFLIPEGTKFVIFQFHEVMLAKLLQYNEFWGEAAVPCINWVKSSYCFKSFNEAKLNPTKDDVFYSGCKQHTDQPNPSRVTYPPIVLPPEFTIELLLTPRDVQKAFACILSNTSGLNDGIDVLALDTPDAYCFQWLNGKWSPPVIFHLINNCRSYLAITFENGKVEIFVNGESVASINANLAVAQSDMPLNIGEGEGGRGRFNGFIEEVRISNNVIAADAIRERFQKMSLNDGD